MLFLAALFTLQTATFVAPQAKHAQQAPIIDGADTDEVWKSTSPINGFRVFDPTEDGEPRFRTEARIAYDARNLYVFVRAFDPRPDSIVSLLSRRDTRTASDQIKIMIDSYYDRRSGYEFAVNPAGVRRDYYLYDDTREDISWDAVWNVETRIDSLGWTAEFAIPLSQLRYRSADVNSMGFMIMRDIARTNERLSWPVYRRSKPGVASQFERVDGFQGLSSPRRVELLPYAVTRNRASTDGRVQEQEFGGDARIGLGSNLTLVAAFNPDFGQVEADPAVLNLSAFEVSFAELRPFFVEGANAFGRDQTLFYSRRIGAGGAQIDAAAKLTGRVGKSTTMGALAAYSDNQLFSIARAARDFRGGKSGVTATLTMVGRELTDANINTLRDRALTAGVSGRHRFAKDNYQIDGSIRASHVEGSANAIARTQRTSVHYYNRADSPLTYDPTRTSLGG
ncbi:MAG TPA: DUF5916 domain-containing protein, partial [Longimicrobiales bacterium]|nr:DUF5916 domain-containing protein [Longimicrobiales bacterium]